MSHRRNRKSIPIPSNWEAPKYQFGQLTREGRIMGIEYSEGNSYKVEGWCYWIEMNPDKELQMFMEHEVELLAPSEIKTMIESRSEEIEMLRAQLNRH